MIPKLMLVDAPSGDWRVLYFVSNTSDRKVYEGHECDGNLLLALSKTFGYPLECWIFTDEDEIDGCTPDRFKDIKGIDRVG